MILDGARTDAERAAGFLVGRAGGELLQHFALATRQRLASGEMQRRDIRAGVLLLAKPYRKSDMAVMIRKAIAG